MDEPQRQRRLLACLAIATAAAYFEFRIDLTPAGWDAQRGHFVVLKWLAKDKQLYDGTGLLPHTFRALCVWIRESTELTDTRYMLLEEKVAIFLHICRSGSGYRNTKLLFNRSTDTISRSE